jgi:DNA-binding MarR family transcriptional regulator
MASLKRENSVGWMFNVLAKQMADSLDVRLKEYDVDIKLWPTLLSLSERQGQTQTELAKSCRTLGYTTTRILDRLEEKKLTKRHADKNSRRTYRIFLTKQGEALVETLLTIAKEENKKFTSRLPKEDYKTLVSILQSLVQTKVEK